MLGQHANLFFKMSDNAQYSYDVQKQKRYRYAFLHHINCLPICMNSRTDGLAAYLHCCFCNFCQQRWFSSTWLSNYTHNMPVIHLHSKLYALLENSTKYITYIYKCICVNEILEIIIQNKGLERSPRPSSSCFWTLISKSSPLHSVISNHRRLLRSTSSFFRLVVNVLFLL